MTRRTSFLTRCFALVLALVMTFSGSNLGIVLQAFAMEAPAASGNIGSLMVQKYNLKGNFAELLMSDDVAGNDSYTYNPPTDADALITIDAATRTVKVKAVADMNGHEWTANKTAPVVNVVTNQYEVMDMTLEGDYYVGTYSYTDPVTVEVKYNDTYATFPDQQIHLEENIKTLKTGYNNVAQAAALNMGDVQYALEQMYPEVPESETALRTAFENAGAKVVGIRTSIANIGNDYVAYLLANRDSVLVDARATANALVALNEQLTAYTPKLNEGIQTLKDQIAQAEALLPEGVEEPDELKALRENLKTAEFAASVFAGNQMAVADGIAALNAVPATGWDVSAAVAANADTVELNSLLAGNWTIPNVSYDMIVLSNTLVAETDVATLTVKGSYSFYKNGALQTPPAMTPIEIKVAEGTDEATKLAKVTPVIESFENGLAENLKGNGFTAEEVEKHFACKVDNSVENVWNVTYAPNQYEVTYTYADAEKRYYGEKITLPVYTADEDHIFEYTVSGENFSTAYDQGAEIAVDGNLIVSQIVAAPFEEVGLYAEIKANTLKDNAAAKTILDALVGDRNIRFRYPAETTLGLVQVDEDTATLSMPAAAATPFGGMWTATGYNADGVAQTMPAGTDATVSTRVAKFDVDYKLTLVEAAEIVAVLNNVNAAIADAAAQKSAMEALAKKDLDLLTWDVISAAISSARTNEDLTDAQKAALTAIRDNCFEGNNLKLYNLVVAYKASSDSMRYFYENVDQINAAVAELKTQLDALFNNDTKGGLKPFLESLPGGAGVYDQLSEMRSAIADAQADLAIDYTLIKETANLSDLGSALGKAAAVSVEGVKAIEKTTNLTKAGLNQAKVKVNVGNIIADEIFEKGDTLTDADVEKLYNEAVAKLAAVENAKHYETDLTLDALKAELSGVTLTGDKTVAYNWTPITYKVVVPNKGTLEFTVANTTVTLPAPAANQWHVYQIGEGQPITAYKAMDYNFDFTNEDVVALFANAAHSYTIGLTAYENVTFGVKLTVEGRDNVEATISDLERIVGKPYTLTELDIQRVKDLLQDEIDFISTEYYNTAAFSVADLNEWVGDPINGETVLTYRWTLKTYDVTINGNFLKSIKLGDTTVSLPAPATGAVIYKYTIYTKLENGKPADESVIELKHGDAKYELTFAAPAAYNLDREEVIVEDYSNYEVAAGSMLEAISKQTENATLKTILGLDVFMSDFDQTYVYDEPDDADDTDGRADDGILALEDGILTINSFWGNKKLNMEWKPLTYKFSNMTEAEALEEKPGTGNTWIKPMADSIGSVEVNYGMAIATADEMNAKLAQVDEIVAHANEQINAMNTLKNHQSDLQMIGDQWATIMRNVRNITNLEERAIIQAELKKMETTCLTREEDDYGAYFILNLYPYIEQYNANDLGYFYENYGAIYGAFISLYDSLMVLKQYPDSLDQLTGDMDIDVSVGDMIVEMAGEIEQAPHDLAMHKAVNSGANKVDLKNLGDALEVALTQSIDGKWVAGTGAELYVTKLATLKGEGAMGLSYTIDIEGYGKNTVSMFWKDMNDGTQDGIYHLTQTDANEFNAAVQAVLNDAKDNGFILDYYNGEDVANVQAGMTLNQPETKSSYTYTLKTIYLDDPTKEEPQELKAYAPETGLLSGKYIQFNLPVPAADAAFPTRYVYEIGGVQYDTTEYQAYKGTIADVYGNLGADMTIPATVYEKVTYTFTLAVEGMELNEDTTNVYTYTTEKVDGADAVVNKDAVTRGINNTLRDAFGYTELALGDFYTAPEMNLLDAIAKNEEASFKWTVKKFSVTVNGETLADNLDYKNLEITLPGTGSETLAYKYYVGGKTFTVKADSRTITLDQSLLAELAHGAVYNIDRVEVDMSNQGAQHSLMADVAKSVEGKHDIAAGVLTSGALEMDDFLTYQIPVGGTIENNTLVIEAVEADDTRTWVPKTWQAFKKADDGSATLLDEGTGSGTITVADDADYVIVTYELKYLTADGAKEYLSVVDKLVDDAKAQKNALDELSADSMIGEDGPLNMLNQGMMSTLINTIGSSNAFDPDPAKNAAIRDHYVTQFGAMSQDCYPEKGYMGINNEIDKLTLYHLLKNYKANDLGYFYDKHENTAVHAAFEAEIEKLYGYLAELTKPEYESGLKNFLKTGVEGQDLSSYYEKIESIKDKLESYMDALTMDKRVNVLTGNGLTLAKYLKQAIAQSEYKKAVDYAVDLYNTENNKVTFTNGDVITLTINFNEVDAKGEVVAKGSTSEIYRLLSNENGKYFTVTEAHIPALKKLIEAKIADLGLDNAATYGNANFYNNPCADAAALKNALLGHTITLTDNEPIELTWTLKDYTVKFVDENGVELGSQKVNFKNLTVNLNLTAPEGYSYVYMFKGSEKQQGSQLLEAEDLVDLFVDGVYTVSVRTINVRENNLINFVDKLNEAMGSKAFTLSADKKSITGNLPADGLMDLATALAMGQVGYNYIGLNGAPLKDGKVYVQTMMDGMLSDKEFGSKTIINMGKGKPAHVMTASMQLGVTAKDIEHEDIQFTINITSVPANMKARIETLANAMDAMKDVMYFTGSGDVNAPELKTYLNLTGNVEIDGKSVNLEKLYQAYLTAMLATLDRTKDNLDEMDQKIAFQFLMDYTACLAEEDVTTKTLENTLDKLGVDVNLSKYSDYFEIMQKFYRKAVIREDGLSLAGTFTIESLIDLVGMDISAYKDLLEGNVVEYPDKDLKASAVATLVNANSTYEAAILDPRNSSAQNKADYTLDLSKRAQSIGGESVIMLLKDVNDTIVLNNATILDLNGYSVKEIKANGRVIIIDSGSNGSVGSYSGNVTMLADNYTLDIETMVRNGYYESALLVAAEKAVSIALNNYASAAFYACADGGKLNTLYELGFDDFIDLIDSEEGSIYEIAKALLNVAQQRNKESVKDLAGEAVDMKDSAVKIVNAILDMFTMGTDGSNTENGLEALINEIAAVLIDVDKVADLTKTGGNLTTVKIATKPWKFYTDHVEGDDYITAGLIADPDAALRMVDFTIKVPKIENAKIQRVLNEMADIASGTAGNPDSYFEVDLQDIELADNTVTLGGGLKAKIALNFCSDEGTVEDFTDHGYYNRLFAAIMAYGNSERTKDYIKNGEFVDIHELLEITTVQEFFDAIQNAVESDKPFDFVIEKIGAKLSEQEIAKLSKLYEKFQAGVGKVLAKVEPKLPAAATFLSDHIDENGVFQLKSATYAGVKGISYKGYGLNFNLTETSAELWIKFCVEDEYKLVFVNNVGGMTNTAVTTIDAGDTFYIMDKAYQLDEDALYKLDKESYEAMVANLTLAGGNFALTYTPKTVKTATNTSIEAMGTPNDMFIWHITKHPTDSKTLVATRKAALDNMLYYQSSGILISSSNELAMRFQYTVKGIEGDGVQDNADTAAINALAEMGYVIGEYTTPEGAKDSHGKPIEQKTGADVGMVTMFNGGYADKAIPSFDVYEEGNRDSKNGALEPFRTRMNGNYVAQWFDLNNEYLNGDQNIRFYAVLQQIKLDANGQPELDKDGKPVLVEKTKDNETKVAVYTDILTRDIRYVAEQTVGKETGVRKNMIQNLINRAIAAAK